MFQLTWFQKNVRNSYKDDFDFSFISNDTTRLHGIIVTTPMLLYKINIKVRRILRHQYKFESLQHQFYFNWNLIHIANIKWMYSITHLVKNTFINFIYL